MLKKPLFPRLEKVEMLIRKSQDNTTLGAKSGHRKGMGERVCCYPGPFQHEHPLEIISE